MPYKNPPSRAAIRCNIEDLPRVLVQMREIRGLSQTRLASLLGVPQCTVGRWEAARYQRTPLGQILRVVRALNVSVICAVRKLPKNQGMQSHDNWNRRA